MRFSRTAKIVIAITSLIGIAAFLVVVDFGVFAGRIHDGVAIDGVDVGGLTRDEAIERMDDRAEMLASTPVTFEVDDRVVAGTFTLVPEDIDWRPNTPRVVNRAFEVGRNGGPVTALGDRLEALTGGVRLKWRGTWDGDLLRPIIVEWRRELAAEGLELRVYGFKRQLVRAIVKWPRRTFPLPVRE